MLRSHLEPDAIRCSITFPCLPLKAWACSLVSLWCYQIVALAAPLLLPGPLWAFLGSIARQCGMSATVLLSCVSTVLDVSKAPKSSTNHDSYIRYIRGRVHAQPYSMATGTSVDRLRSLTLGTTCYRAAPAPVCRQNLGCHWSSRIS